MLRIRFRMKYCAWHSKVCIFSFWWSLILSFITPLPLATPGPGVVPVITGTQEVGPLVNPPAADKGDQWPLFLPSAQVGGLHTKEFCGEHFLGEQSSRNLPNEKQLVMANFVGKSNFFLISEVFGSPPPETREKGKQWLLMTAPLCLSRAPSRTRTARSLGSLSPSQSVKNNHGCPRKLGVF